ncbi:nuclear GTPase SLIP-GC-like [Acanthochromis polyacanthus]|uniref:nuclear GTPase SLIP-GC-like n=1 Tax=Acanthochromis polyacanthus TaxID=80966 RepID=UPI002234619B|nr:nuclear GTPase SLIP-GC-like [Acanthochromis polyacanthus]
MPKRLKPQFFIFTPTEEIILSDVKYIMSSVLEKLPYQGNTKLNEFLRKKIDGLETDKREVIGVFGRTGAGKSSLINAIIGEKNLLPTGDSKACTSVMIKVESNPDNSKYEADIEFITPKEWEDEVWLVKQFHDNNTDREQKKDEDEKLSALYGKEWKDKFPENPVDPKYFREIPEFLQSKKKTLTFKSAKDLSAKLIKYTRTSSERRQKKGITRCFWPLVKCVTIEVPNNDLLQHVTLVDLPGSGDRNKSRDEMWKRIVGDCSTVWIVANIERATSEKEPWEILENTCSLIGNGGQCQQIHFICTKSDVIEDSDDDSENVRDRIVERNEEVKEEVKEEFDSLNQVKKHVSDFQVFTVSSKEFLKKKHLDPEDTEIPKLQEFLKDLNDDHSETLNYVKGAYGILSLMEGARSKKGAEKKTDVCVQLEKNLNLQLGGVQKAVEDAHKAFETRLTEGVERSKRLCEKKIHSILYPPKTGSAFHRTLNSVVQKDGVHKPEKETQINLNATLASWLTDSIDEEFKKTFPNEDKRESFKGAIRSFSLNTKRLKKENQSLKLQLIFLMTEEEIIKTKLKKIIRDHKKTIYSTLAETIKAKMLICYKKAAAFRKKDTLENMRETIKRHLRVSKDTMFEEAKAVMLKEMKDLKAKILETLQETLEKSIEMSMKTDDSLTPDVAAELEEVKKYYKELKRSRAGETSQLG